MSELVTTPHKHITPYTDTPTGRHISSREQTELPWDPVDPFTISSPTSHKLQRTPGMKTPLSLLPLSPRFSFRWTREGVHGRSDLSWTQVGGQRMGTDTSRRWDRDNSKKELKDVVRATKSKFNVDKSHYPWVAQQTTENHTDPSGTWFIITRYYNWKVNMTKY